MQEYPNRKNDWSRKHKPAWDLIDDCVESQNAQIQKQRTNWTTIGLVCARSVSYLDVGVVET
jgi:hypothetical protein